MSYLPEIAEWLEQLHDSLDAFVADQQPKCRGVLWQSWGDLSRSQIRDLVDAGCSEVILNTNDAGARWKWMGPRGKIITRAKAALCGGQAVCLMPWIHDLSSKWMAKCGREMAKLIEDLGGNVRMVQLDWEGAAEKSARRLAKVHPRKTERNLTPEERARIAGVVDRGLRAFCAELPAHVTLGITTLYYRREAGDAAMRWSWTDPFTGIHWSIAELLYQAYARGLAQQAWYAPQTQPGEMQRWGWEKHLPLHPSLLEVGVGVNFWDLQRLGKNVPRKFRRTAEEAADANAEAVLEVGAGAVAGWAGHLVNGHKGVEKRRFEIALSTYRRCCLDGPRILESARTPGPYAEEPAGIKVKWDEAGWMKGVVRGGLPPGYILPKRARLRVTPALTQVAGVIKARLIAEHGHKGARGWVVPFEHASRRWACVVQFHPWTYVDGKKVFGDFTGSTLGVRA